MNIGEKRACIVTELNQYEKDKLVDIIKGEGIDELHLGMSGISAMIDFLRKIPHLKRLYIVGDIRGVDLTPINELHDLELLFISRKPDDDTWIDFSNLKKLRILYTVWWKGIRNIETLENLEELRIGMFSNKDPVYDGKDLTPFSNMKKLKELSFDGAPKKLKSLKGIENLKNLEVLHLGLITKRMDGRSIWYEDASYLEGKARRHLCEKLESLEGIENLTNLREFFICAKKLKTTKNLASLKKLRDVRIHADDIEDKDLSHFFELPELIIFEFVPPTGRDKNMYTPHPDEISEVAHDRLVEWKEAGKI